MAWRRCEGIKLSDGFQCTRDALLNTVPPRCKIHHKIDNGEQANIGNPNPKCKGTRQGKRCTQFAMKGKDFCNRHISDDPAERKQFKAEQKAKELTTNPRFQDLLTGKLSIEELDDEELLRGYPKHPEYGFGWGSGRPPSMIPRALHDRMVSELFKRADQQLKESLLDVVTTMTTIAKDPGFEAKDRIKAAQWVFERIRGKVPDVVQFKQDKPFEIIMEGIVTGPRSQHVRGAEAPQLEADVEEGEWEEE